MTKLCPCHSQQPYTQCCQPYHQDKRRPTTPTNLMRSRYAAYALGLTSYILKTEKPPNPTQPLPTRRAAIRQFAQTTSFVGLQILDASPIEDNHATVTFRAILLQKGRDASYTETSLFQRTNNRWFYIKPQP
ncbi:MAG TPA: YchJ family metal-binding protein [Anaerolineae bacterium]|nr:YchJ family metal-binding protein [Anaerolineae bacterium]